MKVFCQSRRKKILSLFCSWGDPVLRTPHYTCGDSSSARSRPWLRGPTPKHHHRSRLRSHHHFLHPGTDGESQPLQQPQANLRWVHHSRVPGFGGHGLVLSLPCAESLPPKRMHVLSLPLLHFWSPLLHPRGSSHWRCSQPRRPLVVSRADLRNKNPNSCSECFKSESSQQMPRGHKSN